MCVFAVKNNNNNKNLKKDKQIHLSAALKLTNSLPSFTRSPRVTQFNLFTPSHVLTRWESRQHQFAFHLSRALPPRKTIKRAKVS